MLKNCLIIIPFHLPWNWSADYQSQTCRELAKNNLVIAYMSQHARFFLKPRPTQAYPKIENLRFFKPRYPLPFRRFAFIEKLNQLLNILYLLWRYGRRKKRAIVWIFDPVFWFYPSVRYCYPKVISLYDCVDFHESRVAGETRVIRDNEKKLIRCCDIFVVNSHSLAKWHAKVRVPDAIIPLGFDLPAFTAPQPKGHYPRLLTGKPMIGFVGVIDYRLDFELLTQVIVRNPRLTFVFIGEIDAQIQSGERDISKRLQHLLRSKNVYYSGHVPRTHIPNLIHQFTIGIIPYDMRHNLNRYCYPMKLMEYFYMGKPVISTPIEELERFPKYVRVGSNAREWERHIEQLLAESWPNEHQRKQRKIAIANSWEKKIEAISRIIQSKT